MTTAQADFLHADMSVVTNGTPSASSVVTVATTPSSDASQVTLEGSCSTVSIKKEAAQNGQVEARVVVVAAATESEQQYALVKVRDSEPTLVDSVQQAGKSTYVQTYPVYTVADTTTVYTPTTGSYFEGNNTIPTFSQVANGVTSIANNLSTGQIVQKGHNTYLIHPTLDQDGHPILNTTRASPQTVRWLLDNYETAEGTSLSRSTLYTHYLRHCREEKLQPTNAASFGKLLRSVFVGLRTRRLGTRGNSKYHYYGITVKPNSPLNQLCKDEDRIFSRQVATAITKRFKPNPGKPDGQTKSDYSNQVDSTDSQTTQHQEFLGTASGAIPAISKLELERCDLPTGVMIHHVRSLQTLYHDHCEQLLDAIMSLEFNSFEGIWHRFWQNTGKQVEVEGQPSCTILVLITQSEAVRNWIKRMDCEFYQNLTDVLIPDVLRPIPSSLTQAIRNFAKGLENWLKPALGGYPPEFISVKVSTVCTFAQTLRRYTSLNHLAQAARAVLQNGSQIAQMVADLNRVDFHNVQEQASFICQCDERLVEELVRDFKHTLRQGSSLEQWAEWLETVVSKVLGAHEDSHNFAEAARQFLLKWSFYSSMVIRELTLRSAASFGSFHLIRLLYDEYMFYLIERRLPNMTGGDGSAVTPVLIQPTQMQCNKISGGGKKSVQEVIPSPSYLTLNGGSLLHANMISNAKIVEVELEETAVNTITIPEFSEEIEASTQKQYKNGILLP